MLNLMACVVGAHPPHVMLFMSTTVHTDRMIPRALFAHTDDGGYLPTVSIFSKPSGNDVGANLPWDDQLRRFRVAKACVVEWPDGLPFDPHVILFWARYWLVLDAPQVG